MTPTPDDSKQWHKKTHLTPMGDTGGYDEHLLLCQGDRCIAERWLPDDEDGADFDRLISCANACAGMADPEKEIAALRGVIREAHETLKDLESLMRESQGLAGYHLNGDVAEWDSLDFSIMPALAKLQPYTTP